ncbi:uncharacterized protein LOC134207048 [Armigeres subalbatus]|uniref:uncharacterized protein LOC134207048 n=1 Tax=Armigeres subalbatus TaxID=124917 RepID=UPI002ED4957C
MAALQVMRKFPIQEVVESSCEGFVIAKINGIFVCSCYAAPRCTMERFSHIMDQLTDKLKASCHSSRANKEPRSNRRPAYWWNEGLSTLRAACLRARRRAQRARTEPEKEERKAAFRVARTALKKAIKWPIKLKEIVEGLLPQHDPTTWPPIPYGEEEETNAEYQQVSNEKLAEAAKRLQAKKASGPDGIPNVALKPALVACPDMFRTVLQKCLDDFPEMWKIQKLVLLPKPGKPPGNPASYRPICLLDTLGKLLEKIILNRLAKCTEGERGLSKMHSKGILKQISGRVAEKTEGYSK